MPRRVQWHRGVPCLVQGRDPLRALNDILINFFYHTIDTVLDSKVQFSRHFKVHHIVTDGKVLALETSDLSGLYIIHLVCNECHPDVQSSMLFDPRYPDLQVRERLPLCYIIHQNDSIGILVEVLCDRPEPFLASCVPECDGNRRIVDFICIFGAHTVQPEGCEMFLGETSAGIPIGRDKYFSPKIVDTYMLSMEVFPTFPSPSMII